MRDGAVYVKFTDSNGDGLSVRPGARRIDWRRSPLLRSWADARPLISRHSSAARTQVQPNFSQHLACCFWLVLVAAGPAIEAQTTAPPTGWSSRVESRSASYNPRRASEPPTPPFPVFRGILEPPGTVRDPKQTSDWPLTLAQARRIALKNNKSIAFVKYGPREADAAILAEESVFDTILQYGGTWQRKDHEVANEVQSFGSTANYLTNNEFGPSPDSPANVGLTKFLETGGEFRALYSTDYHDVFPIGDFVLLNPYWYSKLTFSLEHSLFRGRGLKINRAKIDITQAGYKEASYLFLATVQEQLRDVELAYWELYYAHRNHKAWQEAANHGLETWKKEKLKLKLGEGTIPDVAQAREQYDTFLIDLTTSRNKVFSAENDLRNVLGIPGWDGERIVPLEAPTRVALPIEWASAVQEAMQRRPELLAQKMTIRMAELEYYRANNGLLPNVRFVADYTMVGLDNQYDQSLGAMVVEGWADWRLGFVYEQPIGRRPATALVRQAQATLCRQRAIAKKQEHVILHALQAAYQEVAAAQHTLAQYQRRLRAAAVQLKSREEFYRLGEMSVDLMLRTQASYTKAEREEVLGVIRYNQALVNWEYAKGSIMDRAHVVVTNEATGPRNRKAVAPEPEPIPAPRPEPTVVPEHRVPTARTSIPGPRRTRY